MHYWFLIKTIIIIIIIIIINQGKDGFLVDPDPDLIYPKRKLAKQNESAATNTATSSVITFSTANNFSFPQHGWGINFEKMPLFTKAEMDRFISNSGKRLGSTHHSVPTSWRKGKTFWKTNILKTLNVPVTTNVSLFAASVTIPSEKTMPHITFSWHCVL